jgi:hypothetical protein
MGVRGDLVFNRGVLSDIGQVSASILTDGVVSIENGAISGVSTLDVQGAFRFNSDQLVLDNTGLNVNTLATFQEPLAVGGVPTSDASLILYDRPGYKNRLILTDQSSLSAAGNRFVYDNDKGALWAGNLTGFESNMGDYSFVLGVNNRAKGIYSFALGGYSNYIDGSQSGVVSGYNNNLYSDNSVVIGGDSNIINGSSHHVMVMGSNYNVRGDAEEVFVFGFSDEKLDITTSRNFLVFPEGEGKVGVGTPVPRFEMDVVGTVNALAYLVNGRPLDTLATPTLPDV